MCWCTAALPCWRCRTPRPSPGSKKRPDVPEGKKLDEAHIESALLKNNRKLTVYTPPGYSKDAKPYGLVLVFDGDTYLHTVPTPVILVNLIAAEAEFLRW